MAKRRRRRGGRLCGMGDVDSGMAKRGYNLNENGGKKNEEKEGVGEEERKKELGVVEKDCYREESEYYRSFEKCIFKSTRTSIVERKQ